jgi:CHAD domain-containing protein
VGFARQPPIATQPPGLAGQLAAGLVPSLIRPRWRRLKRTAKALGDHSPGAEWHAVRIGAKRCRYAAGAVAPVAGRPAQRFAAAADVRAIIGDHQDAVVAEAWLRDTGVTASTAGLAAGELIAAERRERGNPRSRWPTVWKGVSAKRLRRWF